MADIYKATNKQKSEELFWNRLIYESFAFEPPPGADANNEMIKNFWDQEALLYGRVDTQGRMIFPITSNLKPLPATGRKVLFALDFVVDAFKDLRQTAQNRSQDGCLPMTNMDGSTEPYIGPFNPVRAYKGADQAYQKYLQSIYSDFYGRFLVEEQRLIKVTNFDTFMEVFMEYARVSLGKALPFNKSPFSLSPFSSILATGLALDIAEENAGDDTIKEKKFLDNPRLEVYKNLAKHYGFYIDKNVPWRLVANLQSPQMKEYILKRYPDYTDIDSLFEHYYTTSSESDYEAMKRYMRMMYNRVVAAKPQTRVPITVGSCTRFKTIMRQSIAEDYLTENYSDVYWVGVYAKLKNLEGHITYPPEAEDKIIKNAQDLTQAVDIQRAIGYIEYKFKGLVGVPVSTPYEQLSILYASEGDLTVEEIKGRINTTARIQNTVIY